MRHRRAHRRRRPRRPRLRPGPPGAGARDRRACGRPRTGPADRLARPPAAGGRPDRLGLRLVRPVLLVHGRQAADAVREPDDVRLGALGHRAVPDRRVLPVLLRAAALPDRARPRVAPRTARGVGDLRPAHRDPCLRGARAAALVGHRRDPGGGAGRALRAGVRGRGRCGAGPRVRRARRPAGRRVPMGCHPGGRPERHQRRGAARDGPRAHRRARRRRRRRVRRRGRRLHRGRRPGSSRWPDRRGRRRRSAAEPRPGDHVQPPAGLGRRDGLRRHLPLSPGVRVPGTASGPLRLPGCSRRSLPARPRGRGARLGADEEWP